MTLRLSDLKQTNYAEGVILRPQAVTSYIRPEPVKGSRIEFRIVAPSAQCKRSHRVLLSLLLNWQNTLFDVGRSFVSFFDQTGRFSGQRLD